MITLGIKPFGHDTGAAIVVNGKIVAATSEERFNREKHSRKFPYNAIRFCLEQASLGNINQIDEISIGFDYLRLVFHLDILGFFKYFPDYTKESLVNGVYQIKKTLDTKRILHNEMGYKGSVKFLDHHDCHAAVVYYPSEFKDAAILTVDGRGELASTRIYQAEDDSFKKIFQLDYPNSLGAFYSCITEYLGFKDNEDEGKVMGLAAYGKASLVRKMRKVLTTKNGSYSLNFKYFDFPRFPDKNVSSKFVRLFGPPRKKGEEILQRHKDIAKASQIVFEEAMVELVKHARNITGKRNLCLTGGVALNSVVNGIIVKKKIFNNIYIYPAAGDDGTCIGAALHSYYSFCTKRLYFKNNQSPYLGYSPSDGEILEAIKRYKLSYKKSKDVCKDVASLLIKNKCVGWFQDRAEFGPRALGNRSIVVDPRKAKNKDLVNSKIKFREAFRPFAPSVLEEYTEDYFDTGGVISPYMILAFDVKRDKRNIIPAVTHVDGTARVQTVNKRQNLRYWNLINEFYKLTGVPVVLNTSFNRMGEPIVNKPEEAIVCFLGSGLDALALGDYLIVKD